MRLYSGNRLVDIKVIGLNGIDWSMDFYNAGTLFYHEELDAFEVDDIDYCIEQAQDWAAGKGYFQDEDYHEEYTAEIDELDFPPKARDGHYIGIGDWLQDTDGIYVVQSIGHDVEVKEAIFDDDGDGFTLEDGRTFLTMYEAKRMNHY